MLTWFSAVHLESFWSDRPPDAEALEDKYGRRIDGRAPIRVYIVSVEGVDVGFVQWCLASRYAWWPTELGMADAVAIDGLIGDHRFLHRGLAPQGLLRFANLVRAELGPVTLVATTARANQPACRTLERAGFQRIFDGDHVRDDLRDQRVYALRS